MPTALAAHTAVTLTLDGKEAREDVINLCNGSQLGRQSQDSQALDCEPLNQTPNE